MSTYREKDWHVTPDIERVYSEGTWRSLTELGNAAHPSGQQGLLDGPQL